MKVLIIALSGIGDLIMAFPMIQLLRKNFPNAKIDFLVAPRGTKELLENQPFVNKIFILKYLSVKDLFLNSEVNRLITQLKSNNYDVAITIHPSQGIFSALLMKLIDAKIRIQHKYNFKMFKNIGWFLTYSPNIEDTHSVYENLNLIKYFRIQYTEEDIKYSYNITRDEKEFANNFWEKNSLNKYFVIGLHPGTGKDQPWKRWDIDNWIKLMNVVGDNFKIIKFLVFLGPDEIEYEKHFKNIKNVNIIKDLTLKQVIALISRCNYFISNDSGLSHIASLFGIPQLVIFKGGPDPKHSRPFSKKCKVITPQNYEPYYKPYFGFTIDPKKIKNNLDLSPEEVFNAFKRHLDELNIKIS